ncbi:DNA/RNA helicase, superfamily II [Idiomarina sp. A28L]|uniref:DEAD/DEAH box helicase family protein n=1 Tax=Idiomarina sp. A28L TaxID=1036674 RepID=UPI0002138D38|nr:DEAD/DEAH box helicase family protein [Idiomarina sp. A28L]EGN75489.1 DNA/RNA helicase, superfamily II [Idiomarina sp. A28L]
MELAKGHLLTTGTANDPLLPKLVHAINHASAIDICVSFAQRSGVSLLLEPLIDAISDGATVRIMTSDYLYITHPQALRLLFLLQQRGAEVKLFKCSERKAFHLKSYIFVRERNEHGVSQIEAGTAFVGSSNLSESALTSGMEWNLRFDLQSESRDSLAEFAHIRQSFESLFTTANAHQLTSQEITAYIQKFEEVTRQNAPLMHVLGVEDEPEPDRFSPNDAQIEALLALRESRSEGFKRGLVVLATGMGKTWLAAFDAQQIDAERVLFVAHREEILLQAQRTFSSLFPQKSVGFYNGSLKDIEADFLFASIQSIGRLEHLKNFERKYFDYVVVDEFHHATSRTYQKLLSYFTPNFLLGLTATPERTDQSDILSLCDNNLIFERTLVDGIEQNILVPFHYYGIYDEFVNYQEIPWRSGKFDPSALENAFATTQRARHIFGHWQKHQQTRTLGFCISKRHADFMTDYFIDQGIKAVSVYSGSEVRRNEALKWLANGEVEVVFSVDLFNEGTDIPEVDTVLMARPTESKILFLQQLGRGLRQSPVTGKTHVVVLDFIGNHKSFLLKPTSLLGTVGIRNILQVIKEPDARLADGCYLTFDLEVLDFWDELARADRPTFAEDYESLKLELGYRPTAAQFFHAGYYQKAKIRQQFGGWLGMIAQLEDTEELKSLYRSHGEFVRLGVEQTAMSKCFKAILLQAFVDLGGFANTAGSMHGVRLGELAARSWEILHRYPKALNRDLGPNERSLNAESVEWLRYWQKNPIAAYSSQNKDKSEAWFKTEGDRFIPNFVVTDDERELFETIVFELCELRMAEYVERH